MKNWRVPTLLALLGSLGPAGSAAAIEFDEVRNFEDVFVISAAAPTRDRIEVRWAIEDGYYLYNNQFLRFTPLDERVVLGRPQLPPGEVSFDELLGAEVEKFHGELTVTLPLVEVPDELHGVELRVRSQGCLEDELCYPPTEQSVRVDLPPAAVTAGPAGPAGDLFNGLTAGRGDDLPGKDLLAGGVPAALPPEEAFVYEAIAFDADTALVRLTAQAGYYLYTEKLAFRASGAPGVAVRAVELPAGVTKDDPEFGPVPVYFGQVEIPVHLTRPPGPATGINLQADFQGCRDGDICYPPMSRSVAFELPAGEGDPPAAAAAVTGGPAQAAAPLSEQDRLAGLLTRNPAGALVAFFLAGLLLAFTPCVFPMLPILSGIIVGQGARLTTPRAFWLSLVYVLAMAVTYTVAGVLAGLFGQNLQAVFQNPWIISGFVLVFVLLALSMFGFYELQLPGRLQTRLAEASNRQRGGELWGVAVMGFLSALIVGPCVAPPLMAALIVIGSSGDAVLGGAALFALSMGMGVPLLLFGVTAGKFVPRAGAWMNAVKAVFGVGLLALAIWLLERILPGPAIMLLWGALAIGCGVYLGALERIEAGASGWRRLWKSLGVLLLLLGALEIIGAAAGGDYWLRPLAGFNARSGDAPAAGEAAQDHAAFVRIKSLQDLEHAVAAAGQGGRGAMLDFYADWCVECKRMERNTFPDPGVQALLARLQPLQADVTANDADDQALMQAFGIIGPPAILFFDRNGEELKPFRLVGYFDPAEFSTHLGRVLDAQ
ncbi:MAG: protein-disulfide reductase DsbD [Lysobacterales bacterium]|nr:MAG: protein-disulfide reductase DsbD [Xanthomonadales bacterium]